MFLTRLNLPFTSKSPPLVSAHLQLMREINSQVAALTSAKASFMSVENDLTSMCCLSHEATTELYCGQLVRK